VLRFRLGPFPVTLEASFLISAVFLSGLSRGPVQIALWVAVVFVSVLVHELGHALVGLWLGGRPEIILQGLGGVTFPRLRAQPDALRQILLSVAGPAFGLLPGAVAWGVMTRLRPEAGTLLAGVLGEFMMTSVVWAVFNLMPVLPLDGGQVLQSVIEFVRRKPSPRLAAIVSAAFAVPLGIAAFLVLGNPFVAIFFGAMALSNVVKAWAGRAGPGSPEPSGASPAAEEAQARGEVERELAAARAALAVQDVAAALAAANRLELGEGALRQSAGLRIRAGVELSRGDPASISLAALHGGRSFTLWPSADAAVVAARANLRIGETGRAQTWLRRALETGARREAIANDPELGALLS
jgi:stage IV sporulation protein FB